MKNALGLVEIEGLSTAIQVADTMVKTGQVEIRQMENAKGMGWITIKVVGDVGAVTAAVNAGKQVGVSYGHFISSKVIPRPSSGIEKQFLKEGEGIVHSGGKLDKLSPGKEGEASHSLTKSNATSNITSKKKADEPTTQVEENPIQEKKKQEAQIKETLAKEQTDELSQTQDAVQAQEEDQAETIKQEQETEKSSKEVQEETENIEEVQAPEQATEDAAESETDPADVQEEKPSQIDENESKQETKAPKRKVKKPKSGH